MNNIASNIRRIRETKGYSQDYMAAKLNTTQATYARMEGQKTGSPVKPCVYPQI